MEKITFLNETLWPGNLGHFFVVLAFMAAVFSTLVFYFNSKEQDAKQMAWAKIAFKIQFASVVGIFITLFYIIFAHLYEYHYAWKHSSNTLPLKYMISCFWEGQEGSFLLWMFWTGFIGMILLRKSDKFMPGVLAVIAFTQVALGSMLLGVEVPFLDFTIGSSPFDLLRIKSPDSLNIPILAAKGKATYLEIYKDGNGLNQLLQNPWMVIHPPTLFFGFATAVVPFAYSLTAIWINDKRDWMRPALIWSLICVGILGVGIMMGGWWAYESLSFGGYWAWDPVENASLLPWLIIAAAMHMVLIARATGRQIFGSHFLLQLSFLLVLYATFLTRSGILGEASVHSFTDLGLSGQLLLFLFTFIWISLWVTIENKRLLRIVQWGFPVLVLLIILLSSLLPASNLEAFGLGTKWLNIGLLVAAIGGYIYFLRKRTNSVDGDEKWTSREFWMLIGSMLLILSLVQVISSTSIPVINKVFGYNMAVPEAQKYNDIQLWMAMPIMLMMALGQWFRYRDTDLTKLKKPLFISLSISILVTLVLAMAWEFREIGFVLFLFFSIWLIIGNTHYFIANRKIGFMRSGSSIAHAGFGVLMVGIIVSSVNKKILSASSNGLSLISETNEKGEKDQSAYDFNHQNRILFKNVPDQVGPYTVKYSKDTIMGEKGIDKVFYLNFYNKDENFEVQPTIQNNPKMGLLAEPSTKHYLHKDVFTHVNYESGQDKREPYAQFKTVEVVEGETFLSSSGKIKYTILSMEKAQGVAGLAVRFQVYAERLSDTGMLYPIFTMDPESGQIQTIAAQKDELGALISIEEIKPNATGASYKVTVGEKEPTKDYVVMKVLEFPWINLVWLGTILVGLGFGVSAFNRAREKVLG